MSISLYSTATHNMTNPYRIVSCDYRFLHTLLFTSISFLIYFYCSLSSPFSLHSPFIFLPASPLHSSCSPSTPTIHSKHHAPLTSSSFPKAFHSLPILIPFFLHFFLPFFLPLTIQCSLPITLDQPLPCST